MKCLSETQTAMEVALSTNLQSHETLDIPAPEEQPVPTSYQSTVMNVDYFHYQLDSSSTGGEPYMYASLRAGSNNMSRYWHIEGDASDAYITMTHYEQVSRNDMMRYTRESSNPDRTFRALARLAKILGTTDE